MIIVRVEKQLDLLKVAAYSIEIYYFLTDLNLYFFNLMEVSIVVF